MEKIIIIVGPTAVGKSEVAIKLALKVGGEIINADSMQVYDEMEIATAKPNQADMKKVEHHLFSIKSVSENFSVAEFQRLINQKIKELISRKKIPIIVGGTGLYIRAFLYGYEFEEFTVENKDENLEKLTNQELFDMLTKIDKAATNKIHLNNRKRLIRAIQIFQSTGETKSDLEFKQAKVPVYNATIIGLTMKRTRLYERINSRVEEMLSNGLLKEVELVAKKAINNKTAMQAIGYKEFIPYFKKEMTLTEVADKIKKNTRNYAKRQYTFFNNQFKVNWINLDEITHEQAIIIVEKAYRGENNV
jgi:tRNA dimethylallyltransferase